MTRRSKRVCIVTPGYIASTPRVVREADAIASAGYDVRVVFTQGQLDNIREHDRAVVAGRPWRHATFRWSSARADERWAHLRTGVRHRVAQALPTSAWSLEGIAERAEGRIYPELAQLASAEYADLYIGHYPAGLAAAAAAAKHHGTAVGYDVEDLYAETFPDAPSWKSSKARIVHLEERYVPRCAYISAVSTPVAEAFIDRYHPQAPVSVVYNCHAWTERNEIDGVTKDRRTPGLSLYWYSQVVGPDSGIQDALRAASLLRQPVQIHLRGAADAGVRRTLMQLAQDAGVAGSLFFHESVPPGELLSRAVEHDVGLALEVPTSLNKALTASNKMFLYLLAGLAVAATNVPGQRIVMESVGIGGSLYPVGDHRALAVVLQRWQDDPGKLALARAAALESARARWNAEHEARVVVKALDQLFASAGERMASAR